MVIDFHVLVSINCAEATTLLSSDGHRSWDWSGRAPNLTELIPEMLALRDTHAEDSEHVAFTLELTFGCSEEWLPENTFTFLPFVQVIVNGRNSCMDQLMRGRELHPATALLTLRSSNLYAADPPLGRFFKNPSLVSLNFDVDRFDPLECMAIRCDAEWFSIPLGVGDMGPGRTCAISTNEGRAFIGEKEMQQAREMRRLHLLCASGLEEKIPEWSRFLTRRLYDPRLLLFVASFLNGREYKW